MQLRWFLLVTALSFLAAPLLAERVNTLSATADVVAGADNRPTASGLQADQLDKSYHLTSGIYPNLQLDSLGAHSQFTLQYAFGYNRVEDTYLNGTKINLNSESHSAGLGWTLDTERLSVSLNDRFRKSPDFGTFQLFQGIVFTPEGMFFDYQTVGLRRNSYSNSADLDLDYRIGERSHLKVGAGHSFREYEKNELFRQRLPNQQRMFGTAGLSWDLTNQTSFDTDYRGTYFKYQSGTYNDGVSHDLSLGLTHQFTPRLSMSLKAGPSYTRQIGTTLDYWGYNGSVNISQQFEREFVNFFYRHQNGASIGIGSISKTDRLGFGFKHIFAQTLSADFGLSAFKTQRALDNPVDMKGVDASLVFGWLMSQHISLNVGANYRNQKETTTLVEIIPSGLYTYDRRRFFVSLRFDLPDFWRF